MADVKSTWIFGKAASALSLITEDQAREAAAMQEEMQGEGVSLRFGEVLVEGKILPREQIAKVLEAQREAEAPDPDGALFGAIAIENGFLSREALQECLEIQQDLGADLDDPTKVPKIGEILLTEEKIDAAAVEAVLKIQERLRIGCFSLTPSKMLLLKKKREQPLKVRSAEEALFFKMAVRRKLLNSAQVEEILREQAAGLSPRSAAEVACELGYLDQLGTADIQEAVSRKGGVEERRRKHQTTAGIRLFKEDVEFSSLALQNGFLTQAQVKKAEQVYKTVQFLAYPRNLGEILFDLGYLSTERIKAVLDVQRLRGGVLPAYRLEEIALGEKEDEALISHAREGGTVTQVQVTECLRIRRELVKIGIPRKLGEIMLVKGYLFREDVKRKPVLRDRGKRREGGSAPPPRKGIPVFVLAVAGAVLAALALVVIIAVGAGSKKDPGPKSVDRSKPSGSPPAGPSAPGDEDPGPPPGKDPEELGYVQWNGRWVRKDKVKESARREFHEALRKAVAEEKR